MRIAIFSDNFYPELSGITDSIMTTGAELARRGHKIAYYAPYYPDKDYFGRPKDPGMGPNVEIHRLPAVRFKTATGQGRAVIPLGWSLSSLKKFQPDVIHFNLIFGTGAEAVLASRVLHKPLVETNHTPILEFAKYAPIHADWFKRFLIRYDAWFFNRCDFVSSPTYFLFEEFDGLINKAIPHRAVSNPIDVERFMPASKKNKKNFSILYVGRLAEEKNVQTVLRGAALAKKEIPNIQCIIVGRGPYEKNLRELAKDLDIEKEVSFRGFVEEAALPSIYHEADLFCIMSTAETQSLVAMNALACKIPVIAADAWGLKQYITPEVGFRLEHEDVSGLAKKIILLAKDADLRKTMGEAGRKYVEQFSIPSVADTWEQIYAKTIKDYNAKHGSRS